MNITPKDLLDAGVHFGHQVRRWNPNFKPFLFDHRNGISVIDLGKTHEQLEKATEFATETARAGRKILFVGTKAPGAGNRPRSGGRNPHAVLCQPLDGRHADEFRDD